MIAVLDRPAAPLTLSPASLRRRSARFARPVEVRAIKVLDLLTNRYYSGAVRAMDEGIVTMELPLTCRLRAGQRVRFFIANAETGIVAREAMQGGVVTHVDIGESASIHAEMTPDAVAQ